MPPSRSVDLLLVNPGSRLQVYQSLGTTLAAVEPPVWAGLLAGFVRAKGFSASILDANAEDLSPAETAGRIAALDPRLTAVVVYGHNPSASTQVMPAAGAICREIKTIRPDLRTILVGGHVAALPGRTLREEAADFVCGGEGPYTLLDLLAALKASAFPDFGAVRGLWYREDGGIVSSKAAPLVRDLDGEMPGIPWEFLPMDRYRAHNWHAFGQPGRAPYAALYTTLGCPFHCSFCCIQAPFREGARALGDARTANSYRLWSPDAVVRQIDTLVREYGVRNVKIADEIFVLNASHVNGLCDRIIERGYDLNIWAYARVDTLRPETLDKLRRAGFTWLALGIESANSRVRDDAHKGYPPERLFEAVGAARSAGIHVIGNYIFGLPEDDLSTMQETLDLAMELNCEYVNFNCAMAYPGSPLYETAVREGWPLPPDWGGYAQYSSNTYPLPTRHLSGAEVLRFRDKAFRAYFTSDGYREMILRRFGPETLAQVRDMVGHRIDRRFA